jgi:hypothetical protein
MEKVTAQEIADFLEEIRQSGMPFADFINREISSTWDELEGKIKTFSPRAPERAQDGR